MFKNLKKTGLFALFLLPIWASEAQLIDVSPELKTPALLEEPIIWSVTDENSEVILYPTIHILPVDVRWHSPRLTAAINRAQEVWFELPVGAQDDPILQTLTQELGFSPGRPLSKVLTGETYDQLRALALQLDVPIGALEPMRPWMASIVLPIVQLTQAGYDPELGVESRLQAMIKNKPTKFFETAEQQLRFLSDLPEETQVEMLESALVDPEKTILKTKAMIEAWAKGDTDVLVNEFVSELKIESPVVYDVLILNRNRAWVDVIDAEMKGEGIDFIAVGAGRLVGEEGVPELLRQRGYSVKILTKE